MNYVVHFKSTRMLLFALFGAVISIVAWWLSEKLFDNAVRGLVSGLIWVLIVLGPLVFIASLIAFIKVRGKAIELTQQYLYANFAPMGKVTIPWAEIIDVRASDTNAKSIMLFVRDSNLYTTNLSGFMKKSAELNKQKLGTEFSIPSVFFDRPFDEVFNQIRAYHQQYGR
jgi:hypothetical protein